MVESVFQRAMELHRAGRPEDAAPLYEDVIRHDPRHPGAWHLLGVVHLGRGDFDTAREHIERALALCDTKAVYFNNYGAVLKELGKLDEAKAAFERAVELNPDYADAWSNLGWARLERDEPEAAERALQQALELDPRHVDALGHLARLYQDQGELGKAIECHGRAIALRPTDAALRNGLGGTCLVGRQWRQAQESCQRAVSLDPGCSEAWANLASAYSMQDRVTEAQECIDRAASLRPDKPLWRHKGLGLCPVVFPDVKAVEAYRVDLERRLDIVLQERPSFDWRMLGEDGFRPSFQLAHHGRCNRRIMEKFASIFSDGFPPRQARPHQRCGRLRVGFLATRRQTGSFLLWYGPLLNELDRERFEPVVFCARDAMARCRRVIHREATQWLAIPGPLPAAAKRIREADLDVLCYFQIGTDPLSYFLPFTRPAPVQCTSWGTLGTMGIRAVDYYVSSRLAERPGAEEDYTEELHLTDCIPSYQVRDASRVLGEDERRRVRTKYDLPKEAAVYLCPQKMAKFHPAFDPLLRGVLESDQSGAVVIFADPSAATMERLFARFKTTLGERLFRRVRVVARQELNDYRRLVAASDVVLDAPTYSASLTGLDAFAAAVPLVTLPGQHLVERFALGMYRQMGIPDLIAADADGYVRMAVALGTDGDRRRAFSRRIREASDVLFGDRSPVREYESFFEHCGRGATDGNRRTPRADEGLLALQH